MKNIILNNIEYRQTTTCPKVYIAKDGSYILPNGKEPEKVRYGTKSYSKKGYPLQIMICTTVDVIVDDKKVAKTIVKNIGRLVLDAWQNEIDETMEVDHIDRNPFNNNLDNLRLVTKSENIRNRTKFDCSWLHTSEVAKKRVETKKSIREGTYVEENSVKDEKPTFEETIRIKRKTKENNHIIRKINSIKEKINLLEYKKTKREIWVSNNKRRILGEPYKRTIEKLNKLKNELEKLEQKVPVDEIIK